MAHVGLDGSNGCGIDLGDMITNDGLALVAPRVTPVLDPAFRPAVLASHARSAAWSARRRAACRCGSPSSRRTDRSSASTSRCCPRRIRRRPPTSGTSSGSSSSCSGRAAAGASTSTGRCGWPQALASLLQRHCDRPLRRASGRRADVRSPARGRPHDRPAAGALRDQAARPPSRRLPHRLRSRRQRSQGGRGDRRPGGLQRRDGLGPVPQAGSAIPLRRHHGLAAEGRRAPAARRRHRRQRGRRLRQQPGEGGLAVPRRAAGPLRSRACEDLFLEIRRAWGDVPFEVVNDGEVTALAGSMSLGANAILGIALGTSTAAGYVTRRRQHHLVAQRARVRADRPQPRRRRWTSGRATTASARSTSRSRRRAADAGGGHRRARRHAAARAAEARAGADGQRATTARGRSTRRSGPTSATASRTSPTSTTCSTCSCSAASRPAPGGDVIVDGARAVLADEFPELAGRIPIHVPDEQDKRHGQAIAAASLPALGV